MKAESAGIRSAQRMLVILVVLFCISCGAGRVLEVIQTHFYFGWLVPPLFWVYWLILLFSNREISKGFLFKSWLLIDVSILVFFSLVSLVEPGWERSNGSELAIFLAYAPVVVIVGFVWALIPFSELPLHFLEPIYRMFGDDISNWLECSFIAASQSLIFYWVATKVRKKFYFTD